MGQALESRSLLPSHAKRNHIGAAHLGLGFQSHAAFLLPSTQKTQTRPKGHRHDQSRRAKNVGECGKTRRPHTLAVLVRFGLKRCPYARSVASRPMDRVHRKPTPTNKHEVSTPKNPPKTTINGRSPCHNHESSKISTEYTCGRLARRNFWPSHVRRNPRAGLSHSWCP